MSRQQYAPEIKVIRVMCTGRVDLAFVLRAFSDGADGVFIGGCWPGECHYVTQGNYDALGNVHLCRRLLKHIGVNPGRLRLEWISAAQGIRFAEVVNDFAAKLRALGPLGRGEGIDEHALELKLKAVNRLVPYIKLVERERLRLPVKSEEAYAQFYASEETGRLFDELIGDKLAMSQILLLLGEKPLTTREISEALNLSSSEVSRHMTRSSMHGMVRYDSGMNRYALACPPLRGGPGAVRPG